MRSPYVRWAAFLALLSFSCVAVAKCQLQEVGKLSVSMRGLHPAVTAEINGRKALFTLDTGALYSTISPAAAAQYHLAVHVLPRYEYLAAGIGGTGRDRLTTVKRFSFIRVHLPHVRFLVTDHDVAGSSVGSLGQNLLHFSDVEYDFAHGAVLFIRPVGCGARPLAYWAVHTPYSSVRLIHAGTVRARIIGRATINGQRVSVLFDTGATRSVLSLRAARRLGITVHSPGVTSLGMIAIIGRKPVRIWSAPISVFQIGGEKLAHARLLIANISVRLRVGQFHDVNRRADMILGDDFFLSHRIFVAYSQRKLYFTYGGGPIFDVKPPQSAQADRALPGAAVAVATAGSRSDTLEGGSAPFAAIPVR